MPATSVVLALLILGQTTPHRSAAPPGDLRFDWPEGITATVEIERTKERRGSGVNPTSSLVRAKYRMQVLAHPEGRVIRADNYQLLAPAVPSPQADEVAQLVTSLVPTIIVNKDGEFVRIDQVEALKATFDELLFAPLKKQTEANPRAKELIDAVTSDAFLTGIVAQEWDALVGTWVGMPLDDGKIEFDIEQPLPLFPDLKVPLKGTVEMVAKSECTRGGTARGCATFELTSAADPKAVEQIMTRVLQSAPATEGIKYQKLAVDTVVRVTFEIETMLPHDYSMTKTVHVVALKAGDAGDFDLTQVERRTAKYIY